MNHEHRRIALIQFRLHREAERQERECFLRSGGLSPEEVICLNPADGDRVEWRDVAAADVLVLGGAGDHSVTQDFDFVAPLRDLSLRWIDDGRPLFGSCYGHHLLVDWLGGTVVTDEEREEIGTFEIELTPEGRRDEVFAEVPDLFNAQLGHHDRVVDPGPRLVELARSERCGWQAVRMPGKAVYGTQFHPEMRAEDMRDRLQMYSDSYLAGMTLDELTSRIEPSPHTGSIFRRFLELHVPAASPA